MGERYFEREWDGSYFIFDSTITPMERVDEAIDLGDTSIFAEALTDAVDLLNSLTEENEELKKENQILIHFFEQAYYDYMIRCGADSDKELEEMSVAFQSKDLWEIIRYCIGETDKEKLRYYSKLYGMDLE